MTAVILIIAVILALLLLLVTLVQMLYIDTVRLRAKELPFLELFRSGIDERSG